MTIYHQDKQDVIQKFAQSPNDTGSPEVQVALLTQRITDLMAHFKEHHKDNHSRRGLLRMVAKRKSLLKYLAKVDVERYRALIKELGLRK